MAHYKNQVTGHLLFLEDGSDLKLLPAGFELISEDEAVAHREALLLPVDSELQALAKAALHKLTAPGGTAMRCYMAGIAFPADWQAYRAELLAIANGTDIKSTALPTQPSYPAGT